MSIRDNALHAELGTEIVPVDEWGGKVKVVGMSSRQRMAMIRSFETGDDYLHVDFVVACTVDPDTGEQVFDPADRDTLVEGPNAPIEQVAMVAIRLSGLSDLGDVEDEITPLDDSSSN